MYSFGYVRYAALLVSTADDTSSAHVASLRGRVRGSQLPPEYHLDIFLRNVANLHVSWTTDTDACLWKGVICDDSGQVVSLQWSMTGIGGYPQWSHLPDTIKTIYLGALFTSNSLRGTIEFAELPPTVREFVVDENCFTGRLILRDVPKSMQILHLRSNQLCGVIDWEDLPPMLQELDIIGNSFVGTLPLITLPYQMTRLYASKNNFSGSLELECLPQNMQRLHLANNHFTGTINITALPKSMRYLYLENNQFTGHVDASAIPDSIRVVDLSGNHFSKYSPEPLPYEVKVG